MPKKKEKIWTMGCDHEVPPFSYRVWTTKKKSEIMYGFNEEHIKVMMEPKKPLKIKRIKEKEEVIDSEPLGPPGADVGRPAEYEPAFKILKAWVDSVGGPPEKVRKAIRIHWVDYEKVEKKNKRH